MIVVLLAGASSIHTIRWANGLNKYGHTVHLVTQHKPIEELHAGVTVHQYPYRGTAGYFLMIPSVRKLVREINPDIVNAHYASGYATTARFLGFRPWLLSVWGSDIYDFPNRSIFHKKWLVQNIYAADAVASTSRSMAVEMNKIAPDIKGVAITPFGIELDNFAFIETPANDKSEYSITIGTVKGVDHKYGTDILIRSFYLVLMSLKQRGSPLYSAILFRIVGDGPAMRECKELAKSLKIDDRIEFVGRVPHKLVPIELSNLDIYVALSRIESFGVAVLEAGAAGCPVVVSDAGGLPEVVIDKQTGFIVPTEDPKAAASAILRLLEDSSLADNMGVLARNHVAKNYSWDSCLEIMTNTFETTCAKYRAESNA